MCLICVVRQRPEEAERGHRQHDQAAGRRQRIGQAGGQGEAQHPGNGGPLHEPALLTGGDRSRVPATAAAGRLIGSGLPAARAAEHSRLDDRRLVRHWLAGCCLARGHGRVYLTLGSSSA